MTEKKPNDFLSFTQKVIFKRTSPVAFKPPKFCTPKEAELQNLDSELNTLNTKKQEYLVKLADIQQNIQEKNVKSSQLFELQIQCGRIQDKLRFVEVDTAKLETKKKLLQGDAPPAKAIPTKQEIQLDPKKLTDVAVKNVIEKDPNPIIVVKKPTPMVQKNEIDNFFVKDPVIDVKKPAPMFQKNAIDAFFVKDPNPAIDIKKPAPNVQKDANSPLNAALKEKEALKVELKEKDEELKRMKIELDKKESKMAAAENEKKMMEKGATNDGETMKLKLQLLKTKAEHEESINRLKRETQEMELMLRIKDKQIEHLQDENLGLIEEMKGMKVTLDDALQQIIQFRNEKDSSFPKKMQVQDIESISKFMPKGIKGEDSSILSIRYLPNGYDKKKLSALISQFGEIKYFRDVPDNEQDGYMFANCKIHGKDSAAQAKAFLETQKSSIPYLNEAIINSKNEKKTGSPKNLLFISGLPLDSHEQGMRRLFGDVGKIKNVSIAKDKKDGGDKYLFCTIEFGDVRAASDALLELREVCADNGMDEVVAWVGKPNVPLGEED